MPSLGPEGRPYTTSRATPSCVCWTWGLREVTSLSCPRCGPPQAQVPGGDKEPGVWDLDLRGLTFPRHTARKVAPLDPGAATLV